MMILDRNLGQGKVCVKVRFHFGAVELAHNLGQPCTISFVLSES
jgi:hypothetical protein